MSVTKLFFPPRDPLMSRAVCDHFMPLDHLPPGPLAHLLPVLQPLTCKWRKITIKLIEVKFNQTFGWPVAKANGPTFVLPIIALTPNLFLQKYYKSCVSISHFKYFPTWSRGWQHKRRCRDNSRAVWCWTFHWSVTPQHSSGVGSSWPWWPCSPQIVSLSHKYLHNRRNIVTGPDMYSLSDNTHIIVVSV